MRLLAECSLRFCKNGEQIPSGRPAVVVPTGASSHPLLQWSGAVFARPADFAKCCHRVDRKMARGHHFHVDSCLLGPCRTKSPFRGSHFPTYVLDQTCNYTERTSSKQRSFVPYIYKTFGQLPVWSDARSSGVRMHLYSE